MERRYIGKKHLTKGNKKIFLEALKAGKSKHQIIMMLGLDSEFGSQQYGHLLNEVVFDIKNKPSHLSLEMLRKKEPYYENENDYSKVRKYKMSELSKEELLFPSHDHLARLVITTAFICNRTSILNLFILLIAIFLSIFK